jgi:CheY-like chemotaxis protein
MENQGEEITTSAPPIEGGQREESLDILLIEDDSTTAMAIQQALSSLGHMVTYAATGALGIEIAKRKKPQLAIVATALAGEPDGESTSRIISEAGYPILLLSASATAANKLLDLKPLGGLIKPLREGEIELILSAARNTVIERESYREKSIVLSGIVNGMLDSVFIVDRQRKIAFANATASRLTQCDEIDGRSLHEFFDPLEDGNEELEATLNAALSGASAIGSGSRATLTSKKGQRIQVIVMVSAVKNEQGEVSSASLSFRAAPGQSRPESKGSSKELPAEEIQGDIPSESTKDLSSPLRAKAIRAIEMRLGSTQKSYAILLLLSQFEMFRMRYGLNNAEKLVHAFSAHLIKSLPPEDRLYQWSNRTILVIAERDSSIDEVRLEMTAFCSRRVDYYLNATGRSALVTLSASWNLVPLFDNPDAKRDPSIIVNQIDAFERLHSRKK